MQLSMSFCQFRPDIVISLSFADRFCIWWCRLDTRRNTFCHYWTERCWRSRIDNKGESKLQHNKHKPSKIIVQYSVLHLAFDFLIILLRICFMSRPLPELPINLSSLLMSQSLLRSFRVPFLFLSNRLSCAHLLYSFFVTDSCRKVACFKS